MKREKLSKIASMTFTVLFAISMVACTTTTQPTTSSMTASGEVTTDQANQTAQDQPLLEYSIYWNSTDPRAESIVNNPNDIITPYIEKTLRVKIKEFRLPGASAGTSTTQQIFAMLKSANNLPDVFADTQQDVKYLASTGQFADLTDLIPQYMPDYMKYIEPSIWPRWSDADGKHYILPEIFVDLNQSQYASNPYLYGNISHTMFMREDILAKCGYKFTPMAQIKAETTDKGIIPTLDQLKIEPAIDTPEKWVEFLQKVKDLKLKIGNKEVVPLDVPTWPVFHLSTMYDNGWWRINEEGEVDGYLGLPGAKDFYKLWSQLYQSGLLDSDYLTEKSDQLQQKVASGLVACGWTLSVPDYNAALQANLQRDPTAYLRPVIMPKADQNVGYFDIFENGFDGFVINKDFKDIPRLLQYFNWFYTDEGMDINAWGPESSGLWEMKDGKKVFKDSVANDIINNVADGKNADYYGLFDPNVTFWCNTSKAGFATPSCTINKNDFRLNYPIKLDLFDSMAKVFYKNYNMGLDLNGAASYGDASDVVNSVSNYYWNKFITTDIAKLLQAKDDASFDAAWKQVYDNFIKETNYDQAKQNMTKWFDRYGAK